MTLTPEQQQRVYHWPPRHQDDPRCSVPGCEVTDPLLLTYGISGLKCAEHNVPVAQPYGKYVPNRFSQTGSKKSSRNKKDLHAHGCTRCKAFFQDACNEPEKNWLCSFCETGTGWELLRQGRAPCDCCRAHSRLARKEEVATYGLAGDKPWWICTVCARCQVYKP